MDGGEICDRHSTVSNTAACREGRSIPPGTVAVANFCRASAINETAHTAAGKSVLVGRRYTATMLFITDFNELTRSFY
jgi:hypothetical protein